MKFSAGLGILGKLTLVTLYSFERPDSSPLSAV
jgi:hypothetical protein